ncbi:hypothetical protein EDC04DRAFT_2743164, partial [Pisolithus marmoratus]
GSSLAVVDSYSTMPTLPQNTTLLGKFITVKSMVCHAVVCLLAFELSYFLMQQRSCHSWNEALVLSVNKYNASHIQQNVTKAVNVAFQQYGDNVAELCDEILRIITENKMVYDQEYAIVMQIQLKKLFTKVASHFQSSSLEVSLIHQPTLGAKTNV